MVIFILPINMKGKIMAKAQNRIKVRIDYQIYQNHPTSNVVGFMVPMHNIVTRKFTSDFDIDKHVESVKAHIESIGGRYVQHSIVRVAKNEYIRNPLLFDFE